MLCFTITCLLLQPFKLKQINLKNDKSSDQRLYHIAKFAAPNTILKMFIAMLYEVVVQHFSTDPTHNHFVLHHIQENSTPIYRVIIALILIASLFINPNLFLK